MANPALVKKNAIAKTPTARRRSDRFGGVEGSAAGEGSALVWSSFNLTNLGYFAEKYRSENSSCGKMARRGVVDGLCGLAS